MNNKSISILLIIAFVLGFFAAKKLIKPEIKEVVKTEFVEVYIKESVKKSHLKEYKDGQLSKELLKEQSGVESGGTLESHQEVKLEQKKLELFAGAGIQANSLDIYNLNSNLTANVGVKYDSHLIYLISDLKSKYSVNYSKVIFSF